MENQSDINDESESDKEIDFGEDYYSQNSMSNSSSSELKFIVCNLRI
jgi:hypothetical protein